jgi:hypothetical protein
MARFTTDLAHGYPKSALAVFYGGGDPAVAASAARYRAAAGARTDILWRDLGAHPSALSLYGVERPGPLGGFFVKDRHARLHAGLDARIVLWRELPLYRWRARLLEWSGIAALLDRPIVPRRARRLAAA